jgi:S1-C subfamily serine protease
MSCKCYTFAMSFLTDTLVAVLAAYLSFTNTLALQVSTILPNATPVEDSVVVSTDTPDTQESSLFASLPSTLRIVPDLLKNNATYQQAALSAAADVSEPTTTDPLDAIVNIFCTFRTNEFVKTTTGTGFFIDADGVIMTNAHVAQFLLLAEADDSGDTQCIIRNGNPASPKYTASLLYIPPAWVQENASILNDDVPMGTGERDYALLYVNSSLDGATLPTSFPALPFNSELLSTRAKNADVVAAGYPAGALFQQGSDIDLIPQSASTSISELYTFGSNRADVFSIRGSIVGDEGASGGPVLNDGGEVIGMISTRGDDRVDGAGSLRAITLSHVHRTILEETGFGLEESLGGNLAVRSEIFADTLTPFLVTILEQSQ